MRPVTASLPRPSAPRRFGRFELRPGEGVLLADGVPVALGARAFDLLVALADRPGALIAKDELLATVWRGLVVEENNLQVQVSTLRKILGQGALATIPGRGYRFNLPVVDAGDAVAPVALDRAAAIETSADDASSYARTNLPSRLSVLYGRTEDVAAIAALLANHPVVTVAGAGGIGKTRVAQAVAKQMAMERAADYPDGVWWVELAALADGALVPSAVAQAIGVRLAGDRPAVDGLRLALARQRALVVIDNCEHLADAVAALVDAVTAGAPRVSVLVTSQETLKTAAEHVYRLGALEIPSDADAETARRSGAVELFATRAQAVDPRFALTAANLPTVIEICRRLDGIPLAIELAAARLPLLGVEGLRARLSDRFNLLTGGARVVLRRHQTLRATLEWSHALLTADDQTVFRRLSVFAGGFTLEAAQQVASDERIDSWTVLDHLGALVDKSLVLAEGDPIPRYRMLETARAYALERLAEAGETQRTLRRHAQALVVLLEPFERDEWRWRATGDTVPEARAEQDNLRAALEWANTDPDGGDLVIALVGVSYSVWWSSSNLAEGLSRSLALRRHAGAAVALESAARFWLTLGKLGLYSFRRESYDAAVRAATLFREIGNDQRRFDALVLAAVQGARFATVAQMEAQIAEAGELERSDWPPRQRAKLHFARCWWFARQGRPEDALECALRQAAICRDGGVEVGALYAVSNVSFMELLLGRFEDALAHARAAIAGLHALGRDSGAGHLYQSEMVALLMLNRAGEAGVAARNAYPRLLREGDEFRMLLSLALLNAMQGRPDAAARIAGFADALQARLGDIVSNLAPLIHERLDPLLAILSADEHARLKADGAGLRDEEVFSLAFADTE
ncbi:MAG: winged helix-turn-helix domain-containing protein [Betaproteobacteria bacterium]